MKYALKIILYTKKAPVIKPEALTFHFIYFCIVVRYK